MTSGAGKHAGRVEPRAVIVNRQHCVAVVCRQCDIDDRWPAVLHRVGDCLLGDADTVLLPVDVEGDAAPIAVKRHRDTGAGGDGLGDVLDCRRQIAALERRHPEIHDRSPGFGKAVLRHAPREGQPLLGHGG